MSRVLFIHPSKWGRGITAIWIASHAAALKKKGHEVRLFDATFYSSWTENENRFNTENMQYRPTEYDRCITWKHSDILRDLQAQVDVFKPDIIFWGAFSSHVHGEGEYAAIQRGHELVRPLETGALKVGAGLQATADPRLVLKLFPGLDAVIGGESEMVLQQVADQLDAGGFDPHPIRGLAYRDAPGGVTVNPPQEIISDLDDIAPYDYSLFDDMALWRPYNGEVLRAVDYELSRGCPYSCSYCVETVIQHYYGFQRRLKRGLIAGAKGYLRHKSADMIFAEMAGLARERGVSLFRCQDTNFLSIHRDTLTDLADLLDESALPVCLYIETRPEGINPASVGLLKKLRVDGVGMGIELAAQGVRESSLNRYADQEHIIAAFARLRENGIRRTAYNVIGFPGQDEGSIRDTIELNRLLDPDNITVAFYTPFLGTELQKRAVDAGDFNAYEFDLDAQLRTMTRHSGLDRDVLNYYKENFVRLCHSSSEKIGLT
jgi:anaerobic magnesium-protoporphyrin IX monomethyl ester cyclase